MAKEKPSKESRINPTKFALALAIIFGALTFLISLASVLDIYGGFYILNSILLEVYGNFGYNNTILGSFIGGFYCFIDTFILTWIFAWLYNKFL